MLFLKSLSIFIIIFVLSILSGCRDHTLMKTIESPPIELKGKIKYVYKIQPYDRVMIYLYKYPDLAANNLTNSGRDESVPDDMRGAMIDGDGKLSLPLVGRVKLSGLTQTQASRKLEELYSKFVKDPSVTVQVINKKVFVLGEVKNPKTVVIDRDVVSLFEILSKCGGFTDSAVRDNIVIVSHDEKGNTTMRRVDLLTFNRLTMTNILIKPGDIIYVPPDGWKEYRLTTDNYLSVLRTISQIAAPYLMIEDVFNWD